MSVITSITQQRQNRSRFNVHLDGSYAFSLSDLELSTRGWRVGSPVSDTEAAECQSEVEIQQAYDKALRLLGRRAHSVREVSDYLKRKDISAEIVEQVLSRLKTQKYLDDAAFAQAWVRDRQLLRPRSRRRLEQELTAKGVSKYDIDSGLAQIEGDDELEALIDIIRRKQRLSQYQHPEKLTAYLARQGYAYGLIKEALTRLDEVS